MFDSHIFSLKPFLVLWLREERALQTRFSPNLQLWRVIFFLPFSRTDSFFFLLSEASAAPELHFCRPSIHSPPGTDREARRQNLTLSDLRLLSLPSCSADSDWFGSDPSRRETMEVQAAPQPHLLARKAGRACVCLTRCWVGRAGWRGGLSRNGAGIVSPSELQQNPEPLLHRQLFTATKRDEKSFSN